jgi:antitoxin component of MazEF toxin-antitoxin module
MLSIVTSYIYNMLRKIIKTGHSFAVTVSKDFLKQLSLKEGDKVSLEMNAEKQFIIIKPSRSEQQALKLNLRPRL